MAKVEEGMIEQIRAAAMIRKASLQAKIAGEQAKIAQNGVVQAEFQMEQLQAAIAGKKAEIADHESLLGQFKDYFKGMKAAVSDVPSWAKDDVGPIYKSEIGIGEKYKGAGMLGLGTAGGLMAGVGIFWYASYMSMTSMAEASSRRGGELAALLKGVPAAEAQVDTKRREIVIAYLQSLVAQSDIELARELLVFQASRFLNQEFWAGMASVMRRCLRRYLELGARATPGSPSAPSPTSRTGPWTSCASTTTRPSHRT